MVFLKEFQVCNSKTSVDSKQWVTSLSKIMLSVICLES